MKKASLKILTGGPPPNVDTELYGTILGERDISGNPPYTIKISRDGFAGWARLSITSPPEEARTIDYIIGMFKSDIPKCYRGMPTIMFSNRAIKEDCYITIVGLKEML